LSARTPTRGPHTTKRKKSKRREVLRPYVRRIKTNNNVLENIYNVLRNNDVVERGV